MPDDRVIERYIERVLEGLSLLTQQVSRVAWALEAKFVTTVIAANKIPCSVCSSTLIPVGYTHCPACGTETKIHG